MFQNFHQLTDYLKDELRWDLQHYDFEDLVYDWTPGELGVKIENLEKLTAIHQLRAIYPQQPWTVFFVEFDSKRLSISLIRDVLNSLISVRRSADAASRCRFAASELLFLTRFGGKADPQFGLVWFKIDPATNRTVSHYLSAATSDPEPRKERIRELLQNYLQWPDDPKDSEAWTEQWQSIFSEEVETPEVIEKIEQYEVARLLKAPLDHTPLTPQTLNALFKYLELCESEIRKILYRTRENAVHALEIVKLLLSGKERFDRILTADRIESRERHMKFLQKSAPLLADLLTSCDAISESNDPIHLSDQINEVAKICGKLGFNKYTINQSIDRFLTTKTGMDGAEQQWQTKEERAHRVKEIKAWIKQREKIKDVITVSCVKRLREIVEEADHGKMDQEDLMQYAFIGLASAMDRYDWNKGDFHNYVYWPVRNAIENGIVASGFLSGIPKDIIETAEKLQKFISHMRIEMGRNPTLSEVSNELNLPEDRIKAAMQYFNFGEVEYYKNAADIYKRPDILVPAEVSADAMDIIDSKQLKKRIRILIDSLTETERQVLEMRFGLGDNDDHLRTLWEVSRHLRIEPERVRQIESKALRKLRHPTRIRKLEGYLEQPES